MTHGPEGGDRSVKGLGHEAVEEHLVSERMKTPSGSRPHPVCGGSEALLGREQSQETQLWWALQGRETARSALHPPP